MDKSITKNRVAAVRAYLSGIGAPISQVQGYEVVARAQGFENKHTLNAAETGPQSASTVAANPTVSELMVIDGLKYITGPNGTKYRFFDDGDKPMTVEEMRAASWMLKAVIPMDIADVGDIEAQNDSASSTITGIDYALCDISYEVFPYFYGNAAVAMLVSGVIEEPDGVFELDVDADSDLNETVENDVPEDPDLMPRRDLVRLTKLLARVREGKQRFFTTMYDGVPHEHKMVWEGDDADFVNILPFLHDFKHAEANGVYFKPAGEDEPMSFGEALDVTVFEHIDSHLKAWEDDGDFLIVRDIAYGRRVSDLAWEFKAEDGSLWRLGFDFEQTKLA